MSRKGCPDEYPITLTVNNYEIAVFQLTNQDLEDWVYGYLFSEGWIGKADDINEIEINGERGSIHVQLKDDFDKEVMLGKKKHYTAGCGRGVTFFSMTDVKKFSKITSNRTSTLSYLLKKRHEFAMNSPMYLESGGMHGACIIEVDGKVTVREDIGRHNAVDKILGYALRKQIPAEELILLTTGRVSYEMLSKAAKFGIGIIGSRTAATKQAIQLARFLNIEVIGYLRSKMTSIYTSAGRVEDDLKGGMSC